MRCGTGAKDGLNFGKRCGATLTSLRFSDVTMCEYNK